MAGVFGRPAVGTFAITKNLSDENYTEVIIAVTLPNILLLQATVLKHDGAVLPATDWFIGELRVGATVTSLDRQFQ